MTDLNLPYLLKCHVSYKFKVPEWSRDFYETYILNFIFIFKEKNLQNRGLQWLPEKTEQSQNLQF